jgi:hypothetical protein
MPKEATPTKHEPQIETVKQIALPGLNRKGFDSYEDCDCVDRWEAEGGPVVGSEAIQQPTDDDN